MSANNNLESNLSNSDKHWSEWIPVYGAFKFSKRLENYESKSGEEKKKLDREGNVRLVYQAITSSVIILTPIFYLIDKLGKD